MIALGAVIRNDTLNFHFVSLQCCRGLMPVSLRHRRPVAISVLTTDTLQQAEARADGFGNKGGEAALVALHMVAFERRLARDDGKMPKPRSSPATPQSTSYRRARAAALEA